MNNKMQGQITKLTGGRYTIQTVDKQVFILKAAGILRYLNQTPLVGDYVEFDPNGFLQKIISRRNSLLRPKVANVDVACVVISLKFPRTSSIFLDRLLAMIESRDITPFLIFTKSDLTTDTERADEYKMQGYSVFIVNSLNMETLEELNKNLINKTYVFAGQSGVGKTTIINSLGKLNLVTDEISKKVKRGKHTTRVVQIVDYGAGKLVDTPGFSSLELKLTKIQLARSFHDFRRLSKDCFYSKNCLHNKESKCAVKLAVEKGKISKNRYQNYLRLLDESL